MARGDITDMDKKNNDSKNFGSKNLVNYKAKTQIGIVVLENILAPGTIG